jgi:5-methylcytosine-specific restriction protein A
MTIRQRIPDGITREDVERAIREFDTGAGHHFGPSRGYDLVFEGRRYPPKAILALAAGRLAGRVLEPTEFAGGKQSKCFKVLTGLGFEISEKGAVNSGGV